MTLMGESGVILWGEIRRESLLGFKGLREKCLAQPYNFIFMKNVPSASNSVACEKLFTLKISKPLHCSYTYMYYALRYHHDMI